MAKSNIEDLKRQLSECDKTCSAKRLLLEKLIAQKIRQHSQSQKQTTHATQPTRATQPIQPKVRQQLQTKQAVQKLKPEQRSKQDPIPKSSLKTNDQLIDDTLAKLNQNYNRTQTISAEPNIANAPCNCSKCINEYYTQSQNSMDFNDFAPSNDENHGHYHNSLDSYIHTDTNIYSPEKDMQENHNARMSARFDNDIDLFTNRNKYRNEDLSIYKPYSN